MKKGFLPASFILLASMHLGAAPTITSVSGTIATGQVWTVTTTGAGTKSPAKPLLWDNFETGDGIPSNLGTATSYSGSDSIAASQSGCYAGSWCAKSTAGWLNSATGSALAISMSMARSAKYVVAYKRKSTQTPYLTANVSQNTKTDRFWKGADGVQPDWFSGTNVGSPATTIISAESNATPNTGTTRYFVDLAWSQPSASWTMREIIGKINSAAGVADGHIDLRINNVSLGASDTFQMDDSGTPGVSDYFKVEQVAANNSSGQWCTVGDVTFDDIYIDTGTWARAELCNAATYSAATQCEMQIPSAWSATSITLTSNFGALSGGSKWLYVCDSNDSCNATGFDIGVVGKSTIFPGGAVH